MIRGHQCGRRQSVLEDGVAGALTQRVHLVYLSAYSPELNLIEILWRQMKYAWLPLSAYLSFDRLCDEVHRLLGSYGTDNAITFE